MKQNSIVIGKKYNRLLVLEKSGQDKHGHVKFLCQCDCGKTKEIIGYTIKKGTTQSCGCLRTEKMSLKGVRKINDLTGKTFGRLQVIKRNLEVNIDGRSAYWLCKCQCGNEKTICGSNLVRKNGTKSCGCYAREVAADAAKLRRLPEGEAAFNSVYYHYQKNAKNRGYVFDLSKKVFRNLITSTCFYCGSGASNLKTQREATGNFSYNGIDRIDNENGYIKNNCVSCCKICNRMKLTLTQQEFKEWIVQSYHYWACRP